MRTIKGYADGPAGQVHYQIAEPAGGAVGNHAEIDGAPTLLLCHQSPSSSEMFQSAYAPLTQSGIRAIGIDTPGFGQSAPPAGDHSISGYAEAVSAVMDHLNIVRASILGHHTGASIAAEVAVSWPDRISRVILNGPPVMTREERETIRTAIHAAPRIKPVANGQHLVDLWNKRVQFTPGWTSLTAMHNGVVQMLLAGDSYLAGFDAAFDHDIAVPIRKITQPCLILTNTGDDLYASAQRARELRPDFSYRELIGGTHDIVDEQTDAWVETVAKFVRPDG
jgi:pimeloyl-ACP methyl ester carboxylesterase